MGSIIMFSWCVCVMGCWWQLFMIMIPTKQEDISPTINHHQLLDLEVTCYPPAAPASSAAG